VTWLPTVTFGQVVTVRCVRVSVLWRAPMFVLLLDEVCFLTFRKEI
jgi:hypothetical protein